MNRKLLILIVGGLLMSFAAGWWLRPSAPAHAPNAEASSSATTASGEREVLYYRNPMGLPDTSPVPKKDSMGMDYVPVFADELERPEGMVVLGPEKVQKLGVRTALVERRSIDRTVRASASVAVDERRLHTIAPKFEGWVEGLRANQTGMAVRRGAALAQVYSPELVSAQEEYVIARQALDKVEAGAPRSAMATLADAALRRLRNWDIAPAEIAALERGEVKRTLTVVSPIDGVVLEKRATEGMRFMAGEVLFQLADLSEVWVLVEVSPLDLAEVRLGQTVRFSTPALPGQAFEGRVAFIYPTVSESTRTARVRAVLPNPRGALRPALLGQAEIVAASGTTRLVVPRSAVIDSGTRQIVLVAHEGGRFEPRAVTLGRRGDDVIEVLAGVEEGESVVVSANFLIDAESNLKSVLQGLGAHGGHGAAAESESGEPETSTTDAMSEHKGH